MAVLAERAIPVNAGRPRARPQAPPQRGLHDSPWPFIAFYLATVAIFAIIVVVVMSVRASKPAVQTKKLAVAILVQERLIHVQGQAIIALAQVQNVSSSTINKLISAQQSQNRALVALVHAQKYPIEADIIRSITVADKQQRQKNRSVTTPPKRVIASTAHVPGVR